MARVTVRVSDLTGKQIQDEQSSIRLIVEHPNYPEPVGLDVLPDEVLPYLTDDNSRFVVVSVEDPDNPNPQRYALSMAEFDQLFETGDSTRALEETYQSQQQEREAETSRRRGGSRRAVASGASGTRQRTNWASAERAGEPHRGTISEAEKAYVREHLEEVNQRLRAQGIREIDPADPELAERYGLIP